MDLKTIAKLLVLVGMAVLVSGCGSEQARDPGREERSQVFEIRLLGQNPGHLSAALLSVSDVTATAWGQSLEVEPVLDTVNLTQANQAWLLGRVRVPESVTAVDFSVLFDDAGGYESPRGSGAVESRGAVVTWSAPAAWLRLHGRTVIHLDLDRSLVATGPESARLVPIGSIRY